MAHITTTLPNHLCNWPRVPTNLHSERSAHKARRKSPNRRPSKRQQLLACPCIPVVVGPASVTKDDVLFDDDNEVDDSPVSDDGEESLKRVGEEGGGATADCDGSYVAEGYKGDAGDMNSAGAKVLGVKGEGVVVWDVVLSSILGTI